MYITLLPVEHRMKDNDITLLKRAIEHKLRPMKNSLFSFEGPVSVGTPAVTYNILFDTGSCQFWVENYTGNASTTYVATGKLAPTLTYMDGTVVEGTLMQEKVSIGNTVVEHLELENAHINTDEDIDGLMGLCRQTPKGYSTSFVEAAVQKGALERRLFGISIAPDTSESIIDFGTLNSTAYVGNISYTPVSRDSMYWQSNLFSLSSSVYNWSGNLPVIFDSGTSLLVLPDSMHDAFGSYYNLEKTSNGMYYGNKCPITGGSIFNMTFPYMSLSVPMEKLFFMYGPYCYLGMMGTSGSNIIVGNSMTRWFYTVYDGDNNRVGFGQTSYGMVGVGPVPPNEGGLDKVILYSIIAGAVLITSIVVFFLVRCYRRRATRAT